MKNNAQTAQLVEWEGDFGRQYTERNSMTPEETDSLWMRNYGISRTELNRQFLKDVPEDSRILEVGCNIGNQLLLLQRLGYTELYGIEAQRFALNLGRSRTKDINLLQGTGFDLPFKDGFFDLVFTSGVLIHIAPADLGGVLNEIHRCARTYILGMEYFAPAVTEVKYRDRNALLWKMNYAQAYLERFKDLEMVAERKLPYLENGNVDSMFLLRKVKD